MQLPGFFSRGRAAGASTEAAPASVAPADESPLVIPIITPEGPRPRVVVIGAGRMGQLMREKTIFDGRNLYTPAVMKRHGFPPLPRR